MEQVMLATVEAYFEAFQLKDLGGLEKLLSEDVSLQDWEIAVTGRADVLAAVENIFQSLDKIVFNDLTIRQTGNIFWCEFVLPLPDGESISVIDKITVGEDNKITSISAFRQ